MEATRDDIEGLFELQRIDLEIKRLSKELDELPQRGIIVAARDKKTAIEAKSEQVAELKRATTKKITRIDDEDASLAKKEAGVQAAIDAAHGDFRNVEARTKELAGIVRRRATIAELTAPQRPPSWTRSAPWRPRYSLALEEIGAKEQEAIDSFQKQGGDLKLAIAKLEAARGQVETKVSLQLLDVYNRTAARSGVAIGVLDGNRCGACRTVIDGGRLIDLRNQAPLGMCPSCKRLLVIA